MIAHVGGVPLEELLPSVVGAGAGLLVARAWMMLRLRRRREPGHMSDDTTLRMERTFQAPAQAVFDAWTSEEVMRRWWHAEHDWETTEAEVDLRVGGAVRVVMRNPHEDVEYGGGGRYTEIEPPTRLAFTWIWDGNDHAAADRDRLRGDRRRDHRPLHPQRPVGRGGRALARGTGGARPSTTSSARSRPARPGGSPRGSSTFQR